MTETLKACPFCGNKALECKNSEGREMYWVLCRSCHSGPYERDTPKEAITAWNTRPREAELEAEVGRLRGWLSVLEPHLDAVICYASDMNEHPPNRVVAEIRAALSPTKGADDELS